MIEELEDFQYEFDFGIYLGCYMIGYTPYLFMGYCHLHQFVKQDRFKISNTELLSEFRDKLDDGETIVCNDDVFTFNLNEVNDEVIEFIKLCLKYYLVMYTDLQIKDNTITFKRIYEDNIN